jgi:hypothetical protein
MLYLDKANCKEMCLQWEEDFSSLLTCPLHFLTNYYFQSTVVDANWHHSNPLQGARGVYIQTILGECGHSHSTPIACYWRLHSGTQFIPRGNIFWYGLVPTSVLKAIGTFQLKKKHVHLIIIYLQNPQAHEFFNVHLASFFRETSNSTKKKIPHELHPQVWWPPLQDPGPGKSLDHHCWWDDKCPAFKLYLVHSPSDSVICKFGYRSGEKVKF